MNFRYFTVLLFSVCILSLSCSDDDATTASALNLNDIEGLWVIYKVII